tara:strand:+ start:63 stop:560 length:498 start_codon:yes stop_codon:yes gene_type:complete
MDERTLRNMKKAGLEGDLDWQFAQVEGNVIGVESNVGSNEPGKNVPPSIELFIKNTGDTYRNIAHLVFVGAVLPIRVGDRVEAYVNRWEVHQRGEHRAPTYDFRPSLGQRERVAHLIRIEEPSSNAVDGPHGEYHTDRSQIYAPPKEVPGLGEALGAALRNRGPL